MKNQNEVELTIHLITGKTIVFISEYIDAARFFNEIVFDKAENINKVESITSSKFNFATETNSIISVSFGVE